jgi:hypothetical protein
MAEMADRTDMTFRVNRDRFSVLVHLNFLKATQLYVSTVGHTDIRALVTALL